MATVQVHAGAEVYHVIYECHPDTDYAHEDRDRLEALQSRIDLAAAAHAGSHTRELRLVVDPDGPTRLEEVAVSQPLRRSNLDPL